MSDNERVVLGEKYRDACVTYFEATRKFNGVDTGKDGHPYRCKCDYCPDILDQYERLCRASVVALNAAIQARQALDVSSFPFRDSAMASSASSSGDGAMASSSVTNAGRS